MGRLPGLIAIGVACALGAILAGVLLLGRPSDRTATITPPAVTPPASHSAPLQPQAGAPQLPMTAPEQAAVADTACWFDAPAGERTRCGWLLVPEQWGVAGSRKLRLRYVVFLGSDAEIRDPIVYLSGGPGLPAQIDAASIGAWWNWRRRSSWLRRRSVVVFDPRGVGLSDPQMACPELVDAGFRDLTAPLSVEQSENLWRSAAARCYRRLRESGIAVDSYNVASMVKDLKALLSGLGYPSWNLLATSFGTKVALEFLRTTPEGTRSAVLDSTYGVDVKAFVDGAAAAAAAIDGLLAECKEDRACDARYPHLKDDFVRMIKRAGASPLTLVLADPRDGSPIEVHIDDRKLVDMMVDAFYDKSLIADLPGIISKVAGGNARALQPLATAAVEESVVPTLSHGVFLSVECHDELPMNAAAAVAKAAAAAPLYAKYALSALPLFACPAWPAGSVVSPPGARLPADTPVLLLSGALDPVTPPGWTKTVTALMPHSRVITFRGVGHGVLDASECADTIAGRFFDAPTAPPIDDCLLAVGGPEFARSGIERVAKSGSPRKLRPADPSAARAGGANGSH